MIAQATKPQDRIISAPHMTAEERKLYEAGHREDYRGFVIQPKRDFGQHGFWSPEHRCNVNAGWVVTYGSGAYRGCLATPGGTWSHTILGAREMVDDMIAAGYSGECNTAGEDGNSDEFWRLNYARHDAKRLAEAERYLGQVITYDPQPFGARKVLVEAVELSDKSRDRFTVTGRVQEGEEISRIGAHSSRQDITGQRETIYGVLLTELESGTVTQARCG